MMIPNDKRAAYAEALQRIRAMIEGERDEIAVMATVASELRHSFSHFNWVGFYRVIQEGILKVGPYQGGHGCLTIPFTRGVCGKCAREKATQRVADVTKVPWHIACANSTRSEIVIPILDRQGEMRAVLDIDSDEPDAFDAIDQEHLEDLSRDFANLYA